MRTSESSSSMGSISMNIKKESLCKELCIRCHNDVYKWMKHDDESWDKDVVHCPIQYAWDGNDLPPSNCPYGLEHMMKMQMEPVQ